MAFGDVSPGFGGSGGFDAPSIGGSADINLPSIPVPKKKKPAVASLPVTPLPQITPISPVAASTSAFQDSLTAIVANFAASTAALAAPPPVASIPAPPSLTQIQTQAPTILGGSAAPTPPPVPKRTPAQGVTPAAAANRQKRRAAGAAQTRTILTSGQGLLDLEGDQSRRAKKTLLGA